MELRIFLEPQQGATYDQQLAVAQRAEQLEFDALFRSDHFLTMGGDGLPGPSDAWITLAGIARETSSIRLGTLLTSATFRLPGPLAVSVAEVDAMSGGRVELGLGAGWFDAEHTAYGIPFPSVGERFDRLEEQLAIITGLWTTPVGSRFDHDGKHYQLADSPALPKPIQQPRPPVIVGGHGARRTPRLAATYADEYNVAFSPIDVMTTQYARVAEACTAIGRDPASIIFSAAQVVCCGRDSAEVERRAAVIGRSVEDLRANGLCGTPGEIVDGLGTLAAAGATRIYLQFLTVDDLDHLQLLGDEVLPQATTLSS
jgi:alkanesulfonate monooxygenase